MQIDATSLIAAQSLSRLQKPASTGAKPLFEPLNFAQFGAEAAPPRAPLNLPTERFQRPGSRLDITV